MSSTTDHVPEGPDTTAAALPEARGAERTRYAPPETEASFEEIER